MGSIEDKIRVEAEDALGAMEGLDVRRMFGGWGFYCHGLLFAAAWKGEFRFRTRQEEHWVYEGVDRAMLDRPAELVTAARTVIATLAAEPAARPRRRPADQAVSIEPYRPGWPVAFEAERRLLVPVIGEYVVGGIHHVGSTAVPNLPAKPIIDILAGIRDLDSARPCIDLVAPLGYEYAPYLAEEMYWFCKPHPGPAHPSPAPGPGRLAALPRRAEVSRLPQGAPGQPGRVRPAQAGPGCEVPPGPRGLHRGQGRVRARCAAPGRCGECMVTGPGPGA